MLHQLASIRAMAHILAPKIRVQLNAFLVSGTILVNIIPTVLVGIRASGMVPVASIME